jgi:type IX secretion system PorP/SprF family membrane protein
MISIKNISTNMLKLSLLMAILQVVSFQSFAQSRPTITQYFFNPYVVNSAFAGSEDGLGLNMSYRFNVENRQGAASTQIVSTDVKANKSGFGMLFQNDKIGLLSTSQFKFTYAYHLKLADKTQLSFGASSNFTQTRFDINAATINDVDDVFPAEFNNRKAQMDFDFGTVLSAEKFTAQISLPNLRQTLSQADKVSFNQSLYAAVSYKFANDNDNSWGVEPVLAYTVLHNTTNRADVGLRLNILESQIGLLGLYQSDNSFSGALNINLKQGFSLLASYNSTRLISNLAGINTFELAIKTRLFKK